MNPITYTSDQSVEYSKALSEAKDLSELIDVCQAYKQVASDACEAVAKMTEEDFKEWCVVLQKERKQEFSGLEMVEKYGNILLPAVMFRVAVVADELKVPWGLAYIRCKEAGLLREEDGVAIWNDPKDSETGTDQSNSG